MRSTITIFLVEKVASKFKDILGFKEYYRENGIKSKKGDKVGNNISPEHNFYFGDCIRRSGTSGYLRLKSVSITAYYGVDHKCLPFSV
jgi:hypothetical protein